MHSLQLIKLVYIYFLYNSAYVYTDTHTAHANMGMQDFKYSQLPTRSIHLSEVCLASVLTPFTHHLLRATHVLQVEFSKELSTDLVAFPLKSTAKLNLIFDGKMSIFEVMPLI